MRLPANLTRRAAALLLAFGLLTGAWARSQSGQPQLHLHTTSAQQPVPGAAGLTALSLSVDFSVLDGNNQLMLSAEPKTATLRLSNGEVYTSTLLKLDAPWSVVLLLDASKTLTGFTASAAFKTVRFALADAVKNPPADTNFAVLSFGTQPTTVVDFTKNNDLIDPALRTKVRALSDQNSCLNAGVYEAITKVTGASGRRAVLLFTASADGCGQRPVQDIIDLAQRNHIQVYGAGLRGYSINQEQLNEFTEPTGGFATLREQDDMLFAFQNVMNVLGNQWQAKSTLYPSAGPQTAVLTVTLADGTVLESEPVPFNAEQNYARPPEIAIRGLVQSTPAGLRFNLDTVSPELISRLNVNVLSKQTGDAVFSQTVSEVARTVEVAIGGLVEGTEYTLTVEAVDSRGQVLSQASADFAYAPPQSGLKVVRVVPPTDDRPAFTVEVEALNLEAAVKYKYWLLNAAQQADTQPLPGTTREVPVGDPLLIPVDTLATGVYVVEVQALDVNENSLAQVSSDDFAYTAPSAWERLIKNVGQTRLAIVATTLLCVAGFAVVGVAGGVMIVRRSARPKQVALVLPERKIRAATPLGEPRGEPRPERPVSRPIDSGPSHLNRPTNPLMAPLEDSNPSASMRSAVAPSGPLPKACLISQAPDDLQISVEVSRSPFSLGRREGNDVVLRVSNRSGVSGRHAAITYSDGRFYIQDEFSSFGTKVNDERLQAGIPKPLEDGAVIALGPSVKIQFTLAACP